jgi:hypothetical protein
MQSAATFSFTKEEKVTYSLLVRCRCTIAVVVEVLAVYMNFVFLGVSALFGGL